MSSVERRKPVAEMTDTEKTKLVEELQNSFRRFEQQFSNQYKPQRFFVTDQINIEIRNTIKKIESQDKTLLNTRDRQVSRTQQTTTVSTVMQQPQTVIEAPNILRNELLSLEHESADTILLFYDRNKEQLSPDQKLQVIKTATRKINSRLKQL